MNPLLAQHHHIPWIFWIILLGHVFNSIHDRNIMWKHKSLLFPQKTPWFGLSTPCPCPQIQSQTTALRCLGQRLANPGEGVNEIVKDKSQRHQHTHKSQNIFQDSKESEKNTKGLIFQTGLHSSHKSPAMAGLEVIGTWIWSEPSDNNIKVLKVNLEV